MAERVGTSAMHSRERAWRAETVRYLLRYQLMWCTFDRTFAASERLARVNVHARRNELDSYYDGPPVPSLLVTFAENDGIVACFDEEAQHMLESSPEPAFGLGFSPASHGSVLRVLRALDRFLEFNSELFQMIEGFKKSEIHTHAMRNRNRTEPEVQAA